MFHDYIEKDKKKSPDKETDDNLLKFHADIEALKVKNEKI